MIERVEYGVIECFDRFKDFEDFEPSLERVASIKTDKFEDAKKYYEKIKIRSVTKVIENNVSTLEVHQTILFKEIYDENDEVLDFEILEIYGFQDKFDYSDQER